MANMVTQAQCKNYLVLLLLSMQFSGIIHLHIDACHISVHLTE